MQRDEITELLDSILADFDGDTRDKVTVTPKGRMLIAGLDTAQANRARSTAVRVAVSAGYVLAFKIEPWEGVPAFDMTISVTMTRAELLARFAALSPAGHEIVRQAILITRAAMRAGDARTPLEIATAAVREIMQGVTQ